MTEVLRNLPKHTKYSSSYKRGDFFWGLGIEHETYIQSSQEKVFASFNDCMKPERYSVSYYKSYKEEYLLKALESILEEKKGKLKVPVLLNSHSFTHTDKFNTSMTTYEKNPKSNPNSDKFTLFQWMCSQSRWFLDEYEKSFMWDGDSIEFMTQRFYKARVKDVLNELKFAHSNFITQLNALPKQGVLVGYSPFKLAYPTNYPFATYLTNIKNISMFNNGTIHINITLPTRLSYLKKQKASNWERFVESHRKLARLIQWIEPLWIATYGSPDPFSSIGLKLKDDTYFMNSASQRIAVSRYIGLGTFDTDTMPRGKILQIPKSTLSIPWYDSFYKNSIYTPLSDIGLDLNFNKHGAHGLELRFFDQVSYNSLEQILQQVVLLGDVALSYEGCVENPRDSSLWQDCAFQCLEKGKGWVITPEQLFYLTSILKIKTPPPNLSVSPSTALSWIFSQLPQTGFCWKTMVSKNE